MNENKKWKKKTPIIPYSEYDSIVEKLAKINGIEDVKSFLNPQNSNTHSPYLLGNINEAAVLIIDSINNNEKIGISFDVDCDGITSGAIMYRFLRHFTDNITCIHSERSSGHGIENQMQMIEDDGGIKLLVICDSSSNSSDSCKYLQEKGIKILIIDHHDIEIKNDYAIIVNPQQDKYPNKELSGAAVVYKVCQVVNEKLGNKVNVDKFLDLVATGLIADVMSMKEMENRYLIKEGLLNINNPGLRMLLKAASQSKNIDSQTISFTIAPLINGATRLDRIKLAIDMLLEDDETSCENMALEIKKINDERKKMEAKYFKSVQDQVNKNDKVIVVVGDIDKGFNGLVATKLANTYQRPAIVYNSEGERLSGSFRSYGNFDMKSFLSEFYVSIFSMGHAGAGGHSIKSKHLSTLKNLCNERLKNKDFAVEFAYDLELDKNEVTTDIIKQIERFNFITGKGVPQSRFLIKNLLVSDVDIMGKNKDTVKISCDTLCLMMFRQSNANDIKERIHSFANVDVVGTLNINEYYNYRFRQNIVTNQVFVDDIKV